MRPASLKPSNLRFLSGPASPASPLMPLSPRLCPSPMSAKLELLRPHEPPPHAPQTWQWTCHLCKSSYPLGVTRRCLRDGHLFCSGSSVSKKSGVRKHHGACTSEFDYTGWRQQADWRREQLVFPTGRPSKDCWNNCDYPSECRWASTPHDPKRASPQSTPTFATILSSSSSNLTTATLIPTSSPRSDLLTKIRRVTEKRTQDLQALVTNINELSTPILTKFLPNLTPVAEFDEENPPHPHSQFLASPDSPTSPGFDIYSAGIDSPTSPKEGYFVDVLSTTNGNGDDDDKPPGAGAIHLHSSPLRSNPPSPPIPPPSPVLAMPDWMDIDINAPSTSATTFSSFPPYPSSTDHSDDDSPVSPSRASFGFQGLQNFEFGFERATSLIEGLPTSWEQVGRRDSGYATWDEGKSGEDKRKH
ncbi:MAG: hypothetical protein M1812_002791 [Candelaria pacifica]|nr:MAG: hypothetical protein M1812_002791 [Candelaria pacifica]